MKNPFLRAAVFAVLFAAGRAVAGDALPPPAITTTGSAEIRVTPDLADLLFKVGVRHTDLATARKEQADRASKVLATLHAAGIGDPDLQTSQVSVSTHYMQGEHADNTVISYYEVSQDIGCTLRDVKKVGEVTTNVLQVGASGVGEATLRTSELRKHRDEARLQAARAAREKAVAFATELGVKVGKPISIIEYANAENSSQNNQATARGGGGGDDAPQTTFAAGMISVSAAVSVSFLLE